MIKTEFKRTYKVYKKGTKMERKILINYWIYKK